MRRATLWFLFFWWGIYSPLSFASSAWIGNIHVAIRNGKLTRPKLDAIILPQFKGAVFRLGHYADVIEAGGSDGFELSELHIRSQNLNFGDVFVTRSNAMGVDLVNLAMVGASLEQQFGIVQIGTADALKAAALNGARSIAIPALGLSASHGTLTSTESANAIMNAIWITARRGLPIAEIRIALGPDRRARPAFDAALKSLADTVKLEQSLHAPTGSIAYCSRLLTSVKRFFGRD